MKEVSLPETDWWAWKTSAFIAAFFIPASKAALSGVPLLRSKPDYCQRRLCVIDTQVYRWVFKGLCDNITLEIYKCNYLWFLHEMYLCLFFSRVNFLFFENFTVVLFLISFVTVSFIWWKNCLPFSSCQYLFWNRSIILLRSR